MDAISRFLLALLGSQERLSYRRFTFCVLSGVGAYVALMLGKLDGGSWVTLTLGLCGLYIAGDTYEKVKALAVRS